MRIPESYSVQTNGIKDGGQFIAFAFAYLAGKVAQRLFSFLESIIFYGQQGVELPLIMTFPSSNGPFAQERLSNIALIPVDPIHVAQNWRVIKQAEKGICLLYKKWSSGAEELSVTIDVLKRR